MHTMTRTLYMLWALALLTGASAATEKDDKGPLQHLKYRSIGPAAGGRVSRACGVPGDPLTYYAAAASGGVWKSADGGFTWKSIFDDQPTASIGALAVAPSDANVVYVGSGEANIRGNVQPGNGIYKSTNGGKTWKHIWKQKGQIGQIVVHPTNADIAYAAVLGSAFGPNPQRGVYRSRDGGKTWEQVLKKDADTGAIDVCLDPHNPRILFAALWQVRRTPWSLTSGGPGSGLYRSDDGGDTWKHLEPGKEGLPEGPWGRIGLAIAPSDSQRVYALIEADKGGLYRSDDGGDKWELVNPDRYLRQRAWYFSTITVDPHNADVVYCPSVRLLKSIDAGKTFRQVRGPHHGDHHDLWFDPKDPKRIIDSNDGGVDISLNGGATWYAPPLPISQFYHISTDNSVPYRVLGNMQDQGTASGPSNSLAGGGIQLGDWHTVGGGETGFAIADPSAPEVVYAGEYGGYVSRYDHRTRQAQNIASYPVNPSGKGAEELRYRFQWTAPLLFSPHDARMLYHGGNVLFRTANAGKTWQAISPDLTRNDRSKQKWSGGPITGDNTGAEYYCTIFALAESPRRAGVLWAGSDDGLVHVSLDAGKSWANVTSGLTGLPDWGTVACIEASPHDAATAYVVVDAHRLDDDHPYLWKTTDYGKTWVSLTAMLPPDDYLRVVREDPVVPGLLYIGSDHHVSYSPDGGKSWEKLQLNMPTAAICDLVIKDGDLVVGTSGRSVWIFDDLTPIRRWSTQRKGEPQLFPVRAAIRWRYQGDRNYVEDRQTGDNPPHGAIIHYYLERKPKEDLVLEIFDETGKSVHRFTSKKEEGEKETDPDAPSHVYKPTVLPTEPGVQRVAWDLHFLGPKIIPAAKNDAGIPHEGPLVLPGTYTLRLHVDGKVLTGTVEVHMDPRVKSSAEELRERHRLAMQLFAEIGRLVETVLEVRSVRAQLKHRLEHLPKQPGTESWGKLAKELLERLDVLENKLHNPRAAVTYDILAEKGGAKLYSQLVPLYNVVNESDGPITQGMREVFADHVKEMRALEQQWQEMRRGEVAGLNERARTLELPILILPRRSDAD
jgi:photosystem II stability/assembly factor-like uncharacterized protein